MKIFACALCEQPVLFENSACLRCGAVLAYLAECTEVVTLQPAGDDRWHRVASPQDGRLYRLCGNRTVHGICNGAVQTPDGSGHNPPAGQTDGWPPALCRACRFTRVIPDLSVPGHKDLLAKLEVAKRRLLYTLERLRLPLQTKVSAPTVAAGESPPGVWAGDAPPRNSSPDFSVGLAFEFLADPTDPQAPRVLTGHADGLVTINLMEADDVERERRRAALREPYRTLLGHFRHEVGHYYWNVLIARAPDRLAAFRNLFGDDRADYGEALKAHYDCGPAPDWADRCVSAYASVHPWEDWAETWAHYLHMIDSLETGASSGFAQKCLLRVDQPPVAMTDPIRGGILEPDFDHLIAQWFHLTFVLNNLNRGLGQPDAYPFVLATPVIDKLRLIHSVVRDNAWSQPPPPAGGLMPQTPTGHVISEAGQGS